MTEPVSERAAARAQAEAGAEGDLGSGPAGVRRRDLLIGGAAAGAGALAALGVDRAVQAMPAQDAAPGSTRPWEQLGPSGDAFGGETVAGDGIHQPGVATPPQAHAVFLGIDLDPAVDRARLRNLLRLLGDDIARLTAGAAALADQEPELATTPANLTITLGFGPGLVDRVDPARKPSWLAPLPAYSIDRLEDRWSGGDLLIQVCADDPLTLAHAQRMLLKDVRAFGSIRWAQPGFRNARGSLPTGTTMRNLFGQVDGTVNPHPGDADFDAVVWVGEGSGQPAWMIGGSSLVLRRIHMNLETWDEVDRPGREASIGRNLANGAPLTGVDEFDEPDFEARTPQGFTVISPASHMRRARGDGKERILRRVYNYDDAVPGAAGTGAAVNDSGLLFASFQADPLEQFAPIQARLAEADLLNVWTTPIGSAVFAIPPAAGAGGFPGDGLFA
ncbi:putative deferrochelatase/peroxidase EfeN [Pseudoclavibacter triregionum]|nr:putative deferrochelatase/peroxidase EfeN [Pseudoclavibacter triregionum]